MSRNANESCHNLIWDRCPKTTFVGRDRLQIAVFDGTIAFNDGEIQRCEVFKKLRLKVGYHQKSCFRKLDSNRVTAAEKKIRKGNKQKRAQRTIMAVQEENGDDSYLAEGHLSKQLLNYSVFFTLISIFSVFHFSQILMQFCHDISKSYADIL